MAGPDSATDGEIGWPTSDGDPYACGGPYSKAELDKAWAHYGETGRLGSADAEGGDWTSFVERWGNNFTENVTYFDHVVGLMQGRDAVKKWMNGFMRVAPFDTEMIFVMDWVVFDYERSWVNYKLWNRMRDPGDGSIHQVAMFTNLRYGGNNQWRYEENIYNPAEFGPMLEGWNAAKQAVTEGRSTTGEGS